MRSLLLLLCSCALLWWWGQQGASLDELYAEQLYRRWAPLHQALSSWAPLSLFEVFCLGSPLLLLQLSRGASWASRLRGLLAGLLGAYLIFQLSWGLNYGRQRIGPRLGWDQTPVQAEEVLALSLWLERSVLEAWSALPPAQAGPEGSRMLVGPAELRDQLDEGYRRLDWLEPRWTRDWSSPRPKPVYLLFYPFSASGMFSPWTAEAQYDASLPDVSIPDVVAHELAHARGFAREDECNLLGFAAAMASEQPYLQYSASLSALVYALRALRQSHPEEVQAIRDRLPEGVRADRRREIEHARSKPDLLVWWSSLTYDAYLKGQGVKEGTRSYSRMVRLLIYLRRAERSAGHPLDAGGPEQDTLQRDPPTGVADDVPRPPPQEAAQGSPEGLQHGVGGE